MEVAAVVLGVVIVLVQFYYYLPELQRCNRGPAGKAR